MRRIFKNSFPFASLHCMVDSKTFPDRSGLVAEDNFTPLDYEASVRKNWILEDQLMATFGSGKNL